MPVLATVAAVTSLASMGLSIGQAVNANKAKIKADREADKFMREARKKLDVNYYESLAVAKEPYELEREATLEAAATAIGAASESERGAAAAAGRIMMASNQQQAKTRADMTKEKQLIDTKIAEEEARLLDERVALDTGEVEGNQIASQEAAMIKDQAIQNAFSSLGGALTYGDELIGLYAGSKNSSDASSATYKSNSIDPKNPQADELNWLNQNQ